MSATFSEYRLQISLCVIVLAFALSCTSFGANKYIYNPSASSAGASKKKIEKQSENLDLRQKAFSELKPSGKSYSENYLPSSATVSTQNIEAKNPVVYNGLQLGLNYQNYQPQGTISLSQTPNVDLSTLKRQSLVGLELRYNPWKFDIAGQPTLGFRFGSSYSKQAVSLIGANGINLGSTQFQTVYSHFLLSSEWRFPFADRLTWGADFGLANLNVILNSDYTLGNTSDQRNFQIFQTGPMLRTGPLWWTLSFQNRQGLGSSKWAQMESSSILFGVLYGLR